MTPQEAYNMLESLPPVTVKNALLKALGWQARHGKALVHVGFYLRDAWYTEHPRERQTPEAIANRARVARLIDGMGKAA